MMFAQTTYPPVAGYTPPAPQMSPTAWPRQFAVETRGVMKWYGRQTVANQPNLAVSSGDVHGLLDLNGAGKSTTMKTLLGLIKPIKGEMRVFGRDLRASRADILSRIGSLIESPAFYPYLTGAQNFRIVADYLLYDKSSVNAALDIVGPTDAAGKRARQYSPGMKQRLGIAMALISGPELLLLDEPTNGLDPAGVAEIHNLIVRPARDRGVTVMVSSHLFPEIEQIADIVGIIQPGYPRYQGPLSGLRDQGQFVTKVSPVDAATAHLEVLGLRPQSAGGKITLLLLRDDLTAEAMARLVDAGVRIVRVGLRHKSPEEIFLELTEIPVVMLTVPQITGRRG